MTFQNRWMIVGTLTTVTPLHIGDGNSTTRSQLTNSQNGQEVDINSVCTDKDGQAAIPGTTLKGNLRAWARRAGIDTANFENLFGSDDAEKENSVGGKVEFYDAVALSFPTFAVENQPAYWDDQRGTAVMAGIAIDRRTKTASEERLFHHEFVPSGSKFSLTISGQNVSDSELEDLLFILSGFNQGEIAIGAGEGDGLGEVSWELTDLRCLTSNEVVGWIDSGAPTVGYDALTSLTDSERQSWLDRVSLHESESSSKSELTLDVTLDFLSHFLVNDPSRTGRAEEGKTSHAPLLDTEGRLLLPAGSLRGALRSQAEKILRTILGERGACFPDNNGPRLACRAVYQNSDLPRLCPACKLFGAPGWKSPIGITEFRSAEPVIPSATASIHTASHFSARLCSQEFVAVDRFTGGGAQGSEKVDLQEDLIPNGSGGKKFSVASVYKPQLRGRLEIDLRALEQVDASDWIPGLLVFTLRDLMEGDLRFGFGAGKGYGVAHAKLRLTGIPRWEDCPPLFREFISKDLWHVEGINSFSAADRARMLRPSVEALLQIAVF